MFLLAKESEKCYLAFSVRIVSTWGQYLPNSSRVSNAGWKVALMKLQIYPATVSLDLELRKVVFTIKGVHVVFLPRGCFYSKFRRIGLTSLLCMQSSLLTEDGIIDLKMYDRSKQRSQFDLQQNRTDGPFYISMTGNVCSVCISQVYKNNKNRDSLRNNTFYIDEREQAFWVICF